MRFAQALALGLLHGPAELLPISSSAHVIAVPWLLGWDDPELGKSFEVALHAGTTVALLILRGRETAARVRGLGRGELAAIATAAIPPALVGYLYENPIERRLSRPATVAAGLVAGSLAMAVADRAPQRRRIEEAGAADGLWLGFAQACALLPGVSRSGATLAAARALHFTRRDAVRLSWRVALPVTAGASALRAWRLARRPPTPATGRMLATGAAASFASTLLAARRTPEPGPPLPYVLYRLALAAVLIRRASTTRRRRRARA